MHFFEKRQRYPDRLRWTTHLTILLAFIVALIATPVQAIETVPTGTLEEENETQIDWLEPKGLSVVDLVGLVPESHLRDAPIAFNGGSGMHQYVSGERSGNQVKITTRVSPRYKAIDNWFGRRQIFTLMTCLGRHAFSDDWPIVTPPSQLRVYSDGNEITSQVKSLFYYPAGLIKPVRGATAERYPDVRIPFVTDPGEPIFLPANMGCNLFFEGDYSNLTAEFVFEVEDSIRVNILGSETFSFHSYIGPGDAGLQGSLQAQMSGFGNRHDKFALKIPTGTDYMLLNFPMTPACPYVPDAQEGGDAELTERHLRMPCGGTYRLSSGGGDLSVDHPVTMGLPLHAQWQDADQFGGEFLKELGPVDILASPEYFVPAGVDFHPCMIDQNNDCSSDLLQQIFHTTMDMTIYYYQVRRVETGLQRIPIRQVGPGFDGVAAASTEVMAAAEVDGASAQTLVEPALRPMLYLPFIQTPPPRIVVEADDPTGCPCGWFGEFGQMLDYIPAADRFLP